MTLKAVVDKIEDVPESARELYAEKDGKFHLAVEGMVPKERLDQFRDNNINLTRERDDLVKQFEGIDPKQARELAEKAQKERDRKLIDAGKVEDLIGERVKAMQASHEQEIAGLKNENGTLSRQLSGLVVDTAIRDAAAKSGVRPTAVEDVLLRGRALYQMKDGKAVPMDGDKVVFGKSGEAMPIEEWIGGLATTAPHLFESSNGGGSNQARGGSGTGAGRIERSDGAGFLRNLDKIANREVQVV